MNGLCPACRRPYNDKDIEYTKPTAEEMVAHKARQAQKQKKTQAALQKEKQKAEADTLSRKHLAGLRVVQKNLVYVTGLQPTTHEDQLLQILRGQDYFGQYGKIVKIVVSKAKDPSHPHSVGVYVTFEHKEDAERCIAAVNGVKNQERTLRAQFGTTKYCSAYLRGENCTNRNCMFLHEPGEANESYSRADLSALNAGSSQQRPPPQPQQPVASASQPMARQLSSDQPQSPPADRPALPSTASWAARVPQVQPARPESRSTSATFDSPAPSHATPAPSLPEEPEELPTVVQEALPLEPTTRAAATQIQPPPAPPKRREVSPLVGLVKHFNPDDLRMSFSIEAIPQGIRDIIQNYPPLFDPNGGARRRVRRQREEEQRRMEQEAQAFQQPPALDTDDNLELSGSLQLGGEPEDRQTISQPTSAIQPPGLESLDQRFQFGGLSSPGVGNDRGLTPQQHQQMLLNTMKSPNAQGSYLNSFNQPTSFQQPSNPPGHQRNASRFSFANDSSASTNVKPVANAKLMNQQSSMMPSSANTNHFGAQQQPHGNQFYTSNVQGPPPGIKMTGTPPVSGGMTFGQGHGFATGGLQYGAANANFNANEERVRSLLRIGRDNNTGSSAAAEASKREFTPFSNNNYNSSSSAFPAAPGVGTSGLNAAGFPTGPPSYASLSSFSGEDSKQQRKKKGKKHRHANTSSSGGGGLADLQASDHSSMLQARFAQGGFGGGQAAGSNSAVGGGLYSGLHGGGGSGGGYGGRW